VPWYAREGSPPQGVVAIADATVRHAFRDGVLVFLRAATAGSAAPPSGDFVARTAALQRRLAERDRPIAPRHA